LDAHRITGAKLRSIGTELFTIEFVDDIRHDPSLRGRDRVLATMADPRWRC
jgi:hypothetical protein